MSRIHAQGDLCGDKIAYPDGDVCRVWYNPPGNDEAVICFDFSAKDIPAMLWLLIKLYFARSDVFEDEDESEEGDE